jgi:hypothetical protein
MIESPPPDSTPESAFGSCLSIFDDNIDVNSQTLYLSDQLGAHIKDEGR